MHFRLRKFVASFKRAASLFGHRIRAYRLLRPSALSRHLSPTLEAVTKGDGAVPSISGAHSR